MAHFDDNLTRSDNMRFIRGAMHSPMLDKDNEFELAKAWREHNDEKALHKLMKSYARLVVALASKFRAYGLPIGDLMQEGHIGLLHAANRFDTSRDVRFSTYATWWIRASIQDYVLRNWSIVRTGTTAGQKALFFNLRRLRARIEGKAAREGQLNAVMLSPETKTEIATALKVNVRDVEVMDARLTGHDQSLNALVHEDGTHDFQDFLVDDSPNPEELIMAHHDGEVRHAWLGVALRQLDERERRIIRDRHLRDDAATLEDLGKKLGISKERVRQLETRAMAKLKNLMQGQAADPALVESAAA
jgi:RNA polymerase sigma-32 factor